MIMVQKYHSIHEIDAEFIPALELLLQEEIPYFDKLVEQHDNAPAEHLFTYFLFFGTTQNTPIGFAQVRVTSINTDHILPWHQKMMRPFKSSLKNWKQVTWKVFDGGSGYGVFDARFYRQCRDKMNSLLKDYEIRPEVQSEEFFCVKNSFDIKAPWPEVNSQKYEQYILEPYLKVHKTYPDYLSSLKVETQKDIKTQWKEINQTGEIKLGDYPDLSEAPKYLPLAQEKLDYWMVHGASLLTFEKELEVLGCIVVLKGKNGNVFFESLPFESQDEMIIHDDLYIQYALLKFFEMPEAKKAHILRNGEKLLFNHPEEIDYFIHQGFSLRTIEHHYFSRSPFLTKAL